METNDKFPILMLRRVVNGWMVNIYDPRGGISDPNDTHVFTTMKGLFNHLRSVHLMAIMEGKNNGKNNPTID